MKLRQGSEGGGVAIITHQNVKTVHLQEYDTNGLEAVWADAMLDDVRVVVGSVYIPPGDMSALGLLDVVVGNILHKHTRIMIAIDANSRSSLWDDSCVGRSNICQSMRMGSRLEDIISKYDLYVHNDGSPTYRSATAPDVTITKGVLQYGDVTWSITEDDLGSPHDCILLNIGSRAPPCKMEVIDWPRFNWKEYESITAIALSSLYDNWIAQLYETNADLDVMVKELTDCIQDCVDKVATMRTITNHSKPWISPLISDRFKTLRKMKRKCRHRKSPANVSAYKQYLTDTLDLVKESEQLYWLSQCKKIDTLDDRRKWKAINRLTNQQPVSKVRPIRIQKQGEHCYLFDDCEIAAEMEKHHIRIQDPHVSSDDISDFLKNYEKFAYSYSSDDIMNAPITDQEVASTFGTGSPTPGPDNVSSTVIDKADRFTMNMCLLLLFNKVWSSGYFCNEWKREDRAVLAKPGKDDYHQCASYRTVSITSCIGKRFERITSRRLAGILSETDFDLQQFAYLKNRSTTQALMTVVEKVKQALIVGKNAGVVFFDFADAFGTVDRKCLLYKIAKDFGISGKMFLHISSFLVDRLARIKVNGHINDWIESLFGTSAGTSLGPLLFIMYIHDVPKTIFPKFADDLVSVSVDEDVSQINKELQLAVNDVADWSQKWGMLLNVKKTKVMLFGDSTAGAIDIKVNDVSIEQVNSMKYLGMWLDPLLNFSLHIDYAVAVAKRSVAKLCNLFDGREGISVQLGIQLYKSLVRPHLEYAAPVWASANAKDLDKLDSVQVQCLRRITGAKAHSSSAAIEVITGVLPIKIRIRDLCSREYIRLTISSNCQHLRDLMDTCSRKGLSFSPICYLSIISKQLCRSLDGCTVKINSYISSTVLFSTGTISKISVVTRGSRGFHERSVVEKNEDVKEVYKFIEANNGRNVMVFSDGSVHKGSVGCGACAAVLIPVGEDTVIKESNAVGIKTDSVTCEFEGILLGLKLAVDYFNTVCFRRQREYVYLFCDCAFVIDTIVYRHIVCAQPELFEKLLCLEKDLMRMNIVVYVAWIPAHSGIQYNEVADSLAKNTAQDISIGRLCAPNIVSFADVVKLSMDIAMKSWQTKWNLEVSGSYTRQLIPKVGIKLHLPEERNVAISYCRLLLHDTMLMEDAHRTGLSDTPVCECGKDIESADHFLLYCSRYQELRKELSDTVSEILESAKHGRHLTFSDTLLLSPSDTLTRKQDAQIKAALFRFILDTDRKL